MTIIDELKIKHSSYSSDQIDKKIEEWQLQHPGESLEKLRVFLTPSTAPFELRPCFECNEKCIHCFNGEAERDVKRPELKEIYKQLDTMTTEDTVCVIGGEPTMRKDLAEVLKYIKEKGKQVNLHTNGLRLHDESYLNELIPYIDYVTLPIHSSDHDIFDSITQVKGSAEKTIAMFKKLIQIDGIRVTTQTVINQLNYRTLLDTFDMIQDIAPSIRMLLTFPTPSGAAHSSKVTPRYSEIKDYIHPALEKHGALLGTRDIPRCYLYPYQQKIMSNLDGDHSTREGPEILDKRIKAPSCRDCIFTKECIGVWKEYGILYPDLDLNPVRRVSQ